MISSSLKNDLFKTYRNCIIYHYNKNLMKREYHQYDSFGNKIFIFCQSNDNILPIERYIVYDIDETKICTIERTTKNTK